MGGGRTGHERIGCVKRMNRERLADAATAGAWGLFGLSHTQLNEALQTIALLLTIIATAITIGVHVKRWLEK